MIRAQVYQRNLLPVFVFAFRSVMVSRGSREEAHRSARSILLDLWLFFRAFILFLQEESASSTYTRMQKNFLRRACIQGVQV